MPAAEDVVLSEVGIASKFGNIKGIYVKLDEDYEKFPAYKKLDENENMYLYHLKKEKVWLIGEELGGEGCFASCSSSSMDLTQLKASMWEEEGCVDKVFLPYTPTETELAACPAEVGVETPHKNTSGCYYRMQVNFDFFPVYHCSLLGTYLFHVRSKQAWYFAKEISEKASCFNVCEEADEIDVTSLKSERWKFPEKLMRIFKVARPDTSAAPREIAFITPYNNMTGLFLRMANDFDFYPAYHCSEQGLYIYHVRDMSLWFLHNKLEQTTSKGHYYCKSDEVDITAKSMSCWNHADEITKIGKLEKPDTSCVPSMLLVVCSAFKNVGGRYQRLPDDFEMYPSYHCEEQGLYLFHHRLHSTWLLSKELDPKGKHMNICKDSDEVDPTQLALNKWDPVPIDKIEEFKIMDPTMAPKKIAVNSIKDDVSGCYEMLSDLFETYPAYICKATGTHLFHSLGQNVWGFSKDLGGGCYNKCVSDSVDVTKLESKTWADPEAIEEIFEDRILETNAAPKQLVIESELDQMGGCFEREEEDYDGYPKYFCKEISLYVYHVRARRIWKMADTIKASGTGHNSCKSDEVDLTQIPISMWNNQDGLVRIFPLSQLVNRTVHLYYGATKTQAKTIKTNGFDTMDGKLGKAVYLFGEENIVKAKRQAHDEYHREGDRGGVALIECEVSIGDVFVSHEKCGSKWVTDGISACWSSKAGVPDGPTISIGDCARWAIADPTKISIIAVSDLKHDGCPYEDDPEKKMTPEYCPYETKSDILGSPWGGKCPCTGGRSMGRKVKYADKKIVQKALEMAGENGSGYPEC